MGAPKQQSQMLKRRGDLAGKSGDGQARLGQADDPRSTGADKFISGAEPARRGKVTGFSIPFGLQSPACVATPSKAIRVRTKAKQYLVMKLFAQ